MFQMNKKPPNIAAVRAGDPYAKEGENLGINAETRAMKAARQLRGSATEQEPGDERHVTAMYFTYEDKKGKRQAKRIDRAESGNQTGDCILNPRPGHFCSEKKLLSVAKREIEAQARSGVKIPPILHVANLWTPCKSCEEGLLGLREQLPYLTIIVYATAPYKSAIESNKSTWGYLPFHDELATLIPAKIPQVHDSATNNKELGSRKPPAPQSRNSSGYAPENIFKLLMTDEEAP